MKFIIDRSKWRCGGPQGGDFVHGENGTELLNEKGFMCCLGQIARQLGAGNEAILGKGYPQHVVKIAVMRPILVDENGFDSDLSIEAMDINDGNFDHTTREERLQKLFVGAGHEIEFIGEYVKV